MSWLRRFPRTPMSSSRRRFELAIALVLIAIVGKMILLRFANIELFLAASLIAGSVLGGRYSGAVPLLSVSIFQAILWVAVYPGYTLVDMLGTSFFTITGFLFIGLVGWKVKPRILFRTKSVALLTTLSVPLTIAFDVWTDVGVWLFFARANGWSFQTVLELQVPFTLYHILSSLVFVPLLGSIFLLANRVLSPLPSVPAAPRDEKATEGTFTPPSPQSGQ